jgi:hypothetical protein
MEEVLVYYVLDCRGNVQFTVDTELEAQEIALEIDGSYYSDIIIYNETDDNKDKIVYTC